jgi:hypothetical protein
MATDYGIHWLFTGSDMNNNDKTSGATAYYCETSFP